MANVPLLAATVKITAKDIFGGNIQKTYLNVTGIAFDYVKGVISITNVDTNGLLYFPLSPLSTVTYTIVPNPGGSHNLVMS